MTASIRQLARLACLFTIAATANAASVPLIGINPETDISQNPGPGQFFGFDQSYNFGTLGWTFTVVSPIVVTDVGWYDKGGDGLLIGHGIGLWKTDGQSRPKYTQLLNPNPLPYPDGITILFGGSAPLDGPYRKLAIPGGPLTLSPGQYILGGTVDPLSQYADIVRYGLDRDNPLDPPRMPTDPRIILGAPVTSLGSQFEVPTLSLPVIGVELGPMLFVVPVPEPTSIVLIITAVGFLSVRRRVPLARPPLFDRMLVGS